MFLEAPPFGKKMVVLGQSSNHRVDKDLKIEEL
jgi:hypothetical protein